MEINKATNNNTINTETLTSASLKYTRLINNKDAARFLRKNTVSVSEKEVTDVVIESDQYGNNFLKSFDDYLKDEMDPHSADIFKKLLELTSKRYKQQQSKVNEYLSKKREFLQDKLRSATENYKVKHFVHAVELYETALDLIRTDCYPDEFKLTDCDILAVKLALVLSKINVNNYENLYSAKEIIVSLINKYGNEFPSLYYYLAIIHYDLYDCQEAKEMLESGITLLNKLPNLITLNWPGTNDIMVEVSIKTILGENMTSLLEHCRKSHVPDAKCFYSLCEINKTDIYFKSPFFDGYIKVECSNKCSFTYHKKCWKKKELKNITLLEKDCITNDCGGFINNIIIFDKNLRIKSGCSSKIKNERVQIENSLGLPKPSKSKIKITKQDSHSKKPSEIAIKSNSLIGCKTYGVDKEDLEKKLNKSEIVVTEKSLTMCDLEELIFNSNSNQQTSSKIAVSEQTFQGSTEVISQAEYDKIKEELLETKAKYNNLLCHYRSLELFTNELIARNTVDASTETEDYEDLNITNEELKLEVQQLTLALNEVKISQLLDHEMREHNKARVVECEGLKNYIKALKSGHEKQMKTCADNEEKLLLANKILSKEIQELTKFSVIIQQEFNNYKKINDLIPLRNVLFKQINIIKDFYTRYVSELTRKCKIIIHELEILKVLTNVNSFPPSSEVQENLNMWKECLSNVTRISAVILNNYERFLVKFSTDPVECIDTVPALNLIVEPKNIFIKYFQPFFHMNKNLEQNLNTVLENYYRILSIPYPGKCPSVNLRPLFLSQKLPVGILNERSESSMNVSRTKIEEKDAIQTTEITNDLQESSNDSNLAEAACALPIKEETKIPKIIGPDALLCKLLQKFPLTSPEIVENALRLLRNNRGSLSGMDSRSILSEIKAITKTLLKIEQKTNPNFYFVNGTFCGKCSICMEKMYTKTSITLECGHMFHPKCIKTWLENKSVCPICRAHITEDSIVTQ